MLLQSDYFKIRVAVPASHTQAVRNALGDAGAGVQGNYSHCSTTIKSEGRFTPRSGAQPAIGKIGEPETVEEDIVEMLCHKDVLAEALSALRKAHPYEEPAIDIVPRFELK